ncbi:MAG: hypothetical protein WA996_09400 [Candidatus Promineifilaceae bacterium]
MKYRVKFLSGSQRTLLFKAGVITFGYLLLIVIITWPTVSQLTTHMPGTSSDTLLHYWNGWWVRTALSQGQSPFFSPLLFYPSGVSLVTHNIAWLNILPWIVLAPLVGGIPAYNLVLLGSLLLCGWAAYLLAKRLTGSTWAAFLAGVIYIAWPNRISQLDHPNLIATWLTPIFMLGLVNLLERSRWRDAILTGAAFALVGYSRWQNLIPLAFMGLTYFLFRIRDWWPFARRQLVLGRVLVAALIGVVLLLPPIILLASEIVGDDGIANVLHDSDEFRMQTDLLAYITPPGSSPLVGEWSQPLYDNFYPDRSFDRRYPAYIGLVALLLAGLALWRDRRNSMPWLGVVVVLISLAAGPMLRINGDFYESAPTLYRLLAPLRFVRLIRVPDRFNIFLALPVAMLAALGFRLLLAIWKERFPQYTRVGPKLWTSVLVMLVTAEYLITPVRWHDVSYDKSFYATMAEEPGDFAVLNLPFWRGKSFMFDQTFHTRPIVQGNASRLPDDAFAFIYANSWLSSLKDQFAFPPPTGDVGSQLAILADEGIGYIILHKQLIDINLVDHWKRYLIASPRYEDERIAVYSTTPEVGRDVLPLVEPADGLSQIAEFLPSTCLTPGQILGLSAAWANSKPLAARYEVLISLVGSTGMDAQSAQFPLTDLEPNETWPSQTIGQGYYPVPLDPKLPTEQYDLQMQLVRIPQGTLVGDPWSVGQISIQSTPCQMSVPDDALAVNATFGNELFLNGLEISQQGHHLDLTLHWLSLVRMNQNYKIFAHLLEPDTGEIVSQIDVMPLNWLYPTSLWWPGQRVTDNMTLDLEGLSAGDYLISLGVYTESTGERLQVVYAQDLQSAEEALLLPYKVQVGDDHQ